MPVQLFKNQVATCVYSRRRWDQSHATVGRSLAGGVPWPKVDTEEEQNVRPAAENAHRSTAYAERGAVTGME
ncbi:hypothetical protein N7454_001536 [Penicillium verhagenii]|nr:hypothetical protein N7454_001536 [Penicillium verhagenii]